MQQFQENRDLVLLDVREPQAFEQFRIPDSLNIPLFAVKTKTFLKSKPLVLVDEGYRPRQLADACEQLRQDGFEARFLFGGLNAWRMWSAKFILLPLQGDVFAQKALNRMPPQALFAEKDGEYWLIIDVSAGDISPGKESTPVPSQEGNASDGELHPPGPLQGGNVWSKALSVPFDRDHPQSFLADVEHAVADSPVGSKWSLVLIYNKHGEDYEEIERVLRNIRIAPIFFLEGGSADYIRLVAQQKQISQGQQQKFTTTCQPCAR